MVTPYFPPRPANAALPAGTCGAVVENKKVKNDFAVIEVRSVFWITVGLVAFYE
jgi:hypothetical protein